MLRRRFFAVLLAMACSASVTARAQDVCPVLPTGYATLNGSVKAADGGAEILSAVVTATAEFEGFGPISVVGLADFSTGAFSLQVPATGTYVVSVRPEDQAHAPEFYDGVLTTAEATTFSVTDGQVVNNIDFTVVLGTTLSGTVTADGSGDPLEGVGVALIRIGDLPLVNAGALTDANGDYTVSGLATGSYQVVFVPISGDYVLETYNNKGTNPGDAVNVTESGVTGIDAALAVGGHIEGTITSNTNQPVNNVYVAAISPSYQFGGGLTEANGHYSILVPEGTFNVYAPAPANMVSEFYDDKLDPLAADPVNVTATQTTSGIDIQFGASGHITGTVTDAVTHDGIEGVAATAYNDAGLPVATAVTGPTGAYNIARNLSTGQYRVGFVGPSLAFDGNPGYDPAFYPNKTTLQSATTVAVTAPATKPNIDQELAPCGQGPTTTIGGETTTTVLGSTTTSLSGTTTTSLPGAPICGDPAAPIGALTLGDDVLDPDGVLPRSITASDALYILQTAVGTQQCELCVCDVNNSESVTATDALIVLQHAVGLSVDLTCPACG